MRCSASVIVALAILAAGCGEAGTAAAPETAAPPAEPGPVTTLSRPDGPVGTVRMVLAGDVMLGRAVAPIVQEDPDSVFAEVRHLLKGADVAAANLESPLTQEASPLSGTAATPDAAAVLASAGFDLLGIANNHAGDAGPVTDTLAVLSEHGLIGVGAGATAGAAFRPVVIDRNGLRIAFLAFDATGAGPAATDGPGVAWWDAGLVEEAVARARREADVVVVGLHGGVEMATGTDRAMARLGDLLANLEVDVVWGHHSHTVQPIAVADPGGHGRPTLVTTSLGNLIFDQATGPGGAGALLEVLVDQRGVIAYRLARTEHHDLRVHFAGWDPPAGDAAVLLEGEWWTPVRPVAAHPGERFDALAALFQGGDVLDNSVGDPDRDGSDEIVMAFRRPYRETPVTRRFPDVAWQDEHGRSAHLGVFGLDLTPVWVAGALFRPVGAVAACDGALAVAYTTLEDDAVVATGGWTWQSFGFAMAPDLEGPGRPACADADGDGALEAVVLGRAPAGPAER